MIRIAFLVTVGILLQSVPHAEADSCATTTSVAVDTSAINDHIPAYFGKAPGQTFFASDTMIRSLTVWRSSNVGPNGTGMKLWITDVDSTGMPLTLQVVVDGPVLSLPIDDGHTPIEVRYEWDPPIALPGTGRYAFFIQQYLCDGTFDLHTAPDLYPGGSLWRTHRGIPYCELRERPQNWTNYDLVFSIEFCGDASTPAVQKSWGQVKVRYR